MTRRRHTGQPSTPPSSVPASPADSRVTLRTPLKLSRPRRTSFAPVTPRSLDSSGSSFISKSYEDQGHMLTPLRNPSSTNIPNWRVRQDGSPISSDSRILGNLTSEFATPSKHPGPFTPQASRKARNPLELELSNYVDTEYHQVRGCLTDPPPRRRPERLQNLDDESDGSRLNTGLLDTVLPASEAPTATRKSPLAEHLDPRTACASCGNSERLSLLQPCRHYICASCISGSLNSVDRKSLICMHCSIPVHSFKIANRPTRIHPTSLIERVYDPHYINHSPDVFDPFDIQLDTQTNFLRRDNPALVMASSDTEVVVLRIENVPWDVTPPMLENWLENPVVHCHVLLDRKDGRTLSHAYIEVTSEVARATLRSHQNRILGHGRRLRPVTITRSGQEELMHDLFPSWTGKFKGTTPIHEPANGSSEPQLPNFLTKSELYVMAHLIQSPGSHFLKVPCLAYWSLISVLVKFPTPDVFAPSPDLLFDITFCALEKYETLVGTYEYDCILHTELISAAIHCRAFADFQLQVLLRFSNRSLPAINPSLAPPMGTSMQTQGIYRHSRSLPFGPSIHQTWNEGEAGHRKDLRLYASTDPCDRVAQDFGVDPSLVHALAQRLVLHTSSDMAPLR